MKIDEVATLEFIEDGDRKLDILFNNLVVDTNNYLRWQKFRFYMLYAVILPPFTLVLLWGIAFMIMPEVFFN